MSAVFLDTAGWLAALSPRESEHAAALAAYRGWLERGVTLVTTNLVLAEMQILVSRVRGAPAGVGFIDAVHADPSHEVVYVDREMERAAVDQWLRRFKDRTLSLTDAVSFEVMRSRRMRDVLTLDEHFHVAGFRVVPSGR